MNHFDLGMRESEEASVTPFEWWALNVEDIMGIDLDGNEEVEGYSVDGASEAFDRGESPIEYAAKAVSRAGFSLSGPTDHRVAEHGEPVWVCRVREVVARSHQ